MTSLPSPHDTAAWLAMAERYFDATATPEEEKALRHFLTLPESHGAEWDDLRATLSFLSVGRSLHRPAAPSTLPSLGSRSWQSSLRRWGAAASLIALLGTSLYWWGGTAERYVMYAHGEKVTNEAAVLHEMESVLTDVLYTEAQPTIESQLSEIFNP